MFVLIRTKKAIELRSFEGYAFSIPAGVSWIWDKAGEHLRDNIYKVETDGKMDKYGFHNGNGIPALLESTREDWLKEGKKLARVERFIVNAKYIPRASLIKTAQKRGVENSKIMHYLADSNIDIAEISEDINSLPIPESVQYPEGEDFNLTSPSLASA